MIRARPAWAAIIVLAMAVFLFAGCRPKTEEVPFPLEIPQTFSDSGAGQIPDQWWTEFEDPALNTLVEQALAENFDLKTAWQRLQAARAVADRAAADLYPELEGVFETETRRTASGDTDQLRLGLLAAYEVDLWGRIGSAAEAEAFRARASYFDYQAAALSLSAEVARTWYRRNAAQRQVALLADQVKANEQVLHLLKTRFASGQSRAVDVLRQQQLLEATREQKHAAESRVQVLAHQLAVLTGRPPQRKVLLRGQSLPELPPTPATGLPVSLVRRRPDVQWAFYRVKAADRDLAAAVSNQYPRLSLSASLESNNQGASELFEDWARAFTASLAAPLLDAGRRAAEADRARAEKYQRVHEYGQAVLTAFQEVEDALVQEKKQIARIRSVENQVRYASQAYEQLRIEYANGAANFIDVLQALTDRQQLQRDLISAKQVLLEYRIALYRALAGGFQTGREAPQH